MVERRLHQRHSVQVTTPVRIVHAASGAAIQCCVQDVSSEGLGVLSQVALDAGTRLVFETLDRSYEFEVAWCRVAGTRDYKIGLRLTGKVKDLDRLFSSLIAQRSVG